MTFGQVPVRIEDLVERLVKQLQARTGLPADCVFETLADDQDHCEFPAADRFVTVTPQRFQRVPGLWDGAGRCLEGWDGTFRVACLSRFASDQQLRSTRELRDKTRSALALVLKVVDGLDGYKMPSATEPTKSLLREPVKGLDIDVRPKRLKVGPWSVIGSAWSVKFILAVPGGTADP
ncbi:hypothetical protein GobsT_31280 [Gemmata obscuriglobus]|uniref:Uncharacterized protein n=1 Tax=Gemmata obscuriglobus TaxID=114 RepID=A0A2Z3GY51_9BACT|nr:hypothetical protein [Gemmata obscuriglobus]AWM38683.1 hypothetical protein C1280_17950 [Gemmata obscuriglobus]QEG28351.1 hypothetical protein GobsT_31280 [Gemmata obscuriglobus]VTS06239.1 unnamed protein product [Gemmata obscuriglobus UQM 2246]